MPIDARYRIDANGDVRVELGAYDRRLPLVIDPTLNFSTFVAGFVKDMAVDADGNVFLTGVAPAGYVATPGAYQTTRKPSFVTKLDPTGSHVFYATYLGGTGIENATAIAVDAAGSAYVAGYTSSSDFPTTTGAALRTCDPIQFGRCVAHGFVTKLNATGSALIYSTYLGPLGSDPSLADGYPTDIALDASGRASVVGITASTAFPATSGSLSPCSDTSQGFLITLNAAGTALAFATCIGGSSYEMARGIAVTPAGTRIVTGDTASSDFPLVNSAQPGFGGYLDLFAVGFGPTGALLFSTVYGGDFEEGGFGAAVAEDGSIWIAGVTGSTDIPGDERRIGTLGSFDALVLHLSADGDQFLSVTRLGGKRADRAVAIAAGANGRIHFAGDSGSADFPATEDAYQRTLGSSSYTDLFYGTLRESDATLTHLTLFGGAGRDTLWALGVGPEGEAYLAGDTSSTVPLRNASRTSGRSFLVRFDADVIGTGLQKDIVLHAHRATPFGAWRIENDATAAGGRNVRHPNAGAATIGTPLAAPANYLELSFTAQAHVAYRLWLRGKADGDHYSNDSVFVQFSDTVDPGDQPIWRIGTTSATAVQIERCVACGLRGWGWNDNGSSSTPQDRLGALVRFATDGQHTIRIQTREDGLALDQIVLSSERYADTPPGAGRDDATLLSEGTAGGTCGAGEVVLHAAEASRAGAWQRDRRRNRGLRRAADPSRCACGAPECAAGGSPELLRADVHGAGERGLSPLDPWQRCRQPLVERFGVGAVLRQRLGLGCCHVADREPIGRDLRARELHELSHQRLGLERQRVRRHVARCAGALRNQRDPPHPHPDARGWPVDRSDRPFGGEVLLIGARAGPKRRDHPRVLCGRRGRHDVTGAVGLSRGGRSPKGGLGLLNRVFDVPTGTMDGSCLPAARARLAARRHGPARRTASLIDRSGPNNGRATKTLSTACNFSLLLCSNFLLNHAMITCSRRALSRPNLTLQTNPPGAVKPELRPVEHALSSTTVRVRPSGERHCPHLREDRLQGELSMPAGTVSSRARLSIIAALLVCASVTPSSVTLRAAVSERQKAGPACGATRRTRNGTVDRNHPRRERRRRTHRRPRGGRHAGAIPAGDQRARGHAAGRRAGAACRQSCDRTYFPRSCGRRRERADRCDGGRRRRCARSSVSTAPGSASR